MRLVRSHPHSFNDQDWPFAVPQNSLAISTKPVLEQGLPVLLVSHDHDGVWQVLCNTTTREEDCLVVCLGCCFERDPTIGELATLPAGWTAQRQYIGAVWVKRESESAVGDEA